MWKTLPWKGIPLFKVGKFRMDLLVLVHFTLPRFSTPVPGPSTRQALCVKPDVKHCVKPYILPDEIFNWTINRTERGSTGRAENGTRGKTGEGEKKRRSLQTNKQKSTPFSSPCFSKWKSRIGDFQLSFTSVSKQVLVRSLSYGN